MRNSFSTSESFDHDSIFSDPIPDDELFIHYKDIRTDVREDPQETTGIETIMQPTEERGVIILIEDVASGPDARWRTHGLDRRRTILEDDVRLGGRNFSLSFECSVQRYYSIAHRYVKNKEETAVLFCTDLADQFTKCSLFALSVASQGTGRISSIIRKELLHS